VRGRECVGPDAAATETAPAFTSPSRSPLAEAPDALLDPTAAAEAWTGCRVRVVPNC
jgi:hypothetical protein